MSNVPNTTVAGGGGACGAPNEDGQNGRDGSLSITAFAFHEKLCVAYVYDERGELLRYRIFTHDLDAATWARKKAMKLARRVPRDFNDAMRGPLPILPYCVRVYTTA